MPNRWEYEAGRAEVDNILGMSDADAQAAYDEALVTFVGAAVTTLHTEARARIAS